VSFLGTLGKSSSLVANHQFVGAMLSFGSSALMSDTLKDKSDVHEEVIRTYDIECTKIPGRYFVKTIADAGPEIFHLIHQSHLRVSPKYHLHRILGH
jgi:hypothetical protein